MEATSAHSAARPTATAIAGVVALYLIFIALLGIGNEIRYQGCVSRIDQQRLVNVTQNASRPAPVDLNCKRMPF